MRPERGARPATSRSRRLGGFAASILLVAALSLLVAVSPAVSASSYGSGGPVSWTNGLVLCQFSPSTPMVGVSSLGLNGTGITMGALSVSEVRPNQSVAAVAQLSALDWHVANLSTEDGYDLAYSVQVPLMGASGTGPTLGSADLSFDFILPAYQGSPEGPTNTVDVLVSIANWTWQAVGDHLVMTFGAWPSFPTGESLSASTAAGWLLAGTSNSSGAELERVGLNTTASATTLSGAPATVAANGSLALASPEQASLSVSFGASAGTFTSLLFTAQIGVVLPATIAGVPIGELAAAGAAAAAVSLLAAGATRRLRRRPSKLIYVTEEEKQP